MAENIVLQPYATLQNSSIIATTNANNAIITTAFADCLSLSGTNPNQMQANLDMNSQQIINLPAPSTLNSPIRLVDFQQALTGTSSSVFGLLAGTNVWTGTLNTFNNGIATAVAGINVLAASSNTGAENSIVVQNSGTGATTGTQAGFIASLTGLANGALHMSSLGGANPFGLINTGASLTTGLVFSTNAGPITANAKTTLQFQSNSVAIGDYGLTTASTWTFSAPTVVVAIGTSTVSGGANTGNNNTVQSVNTGTSTNASTEASFFASVPGAGTTIVGTFGGSGASGLNGLVQTTSGLTNGLTLKTLAGPITLQPATQVLITGPGATSGTNALVVQNSTPATLLSVRDDGLISASAFSCSGGVITQSSVANGTGSAPLLALQFATAGIGIYSGTGAPTASAAQGSLYIRTDGGAATALYLNTSAGSGTTWTAVT